MTKASFLLLISLVVILGVFVANFSSAFEINEFGKIILEHKRYTIGFENESRFQMHNQNSIQHPNKIAQPAGTAKRISPSVANDSQAITSCGEIYENGSYYLTNDINTSEHKTCIKIYANNVTLDMRGHTINLTDKNYAIYIEDELYGISIKNGSIILNGYVSGNGITGYDTKNLSLENMILFAEGYAVDMWGAENLMMNKVKIESGSAWIGGSGRIKNTQFKGGLEGIDYSTCSGDASLILENVTGSRSLPVQILKESDKLIENKDFDGILICDANNLTLKNINIESSPGFMGILISSNIAINNLSAQSAKGPEIVAADNLFMNNTSLVIYDEYIHLVGISNSLLENVRLIDAFVAQSPGQIRGLIEFFGCNNVTIRNSAIKPSENEYFSPKVSFYDSGDITLINTSLAGGVWLYSSDQNTPHCSFTFNNVTAKNDKQILFYNQNNSIIKDKDLGGLILCKVNNAKIENITINNTLSSALEILYSTNAAVTKTNIENSEGFIGIYSSNLTIDNSNFYNNRGGIEISNCENVTILNNKIRKSFAQGITISGTTNTIVKNNTFSGNWFIDLLIEDNGGLIEDNKFTGRTSKLNVSEEHDFSLGILTISEKSSQRATIKNNKIENYSIGIYIFTEQNPENISIFNNFFNNSFDIIMIKDWRNINSSYNLSANTTLIPKTNIVGGPNTGGNFWAKPNGTGYSETCADANEDYICDQPYWNINQGLPGEEDFEEGTKNISITDYLPLRLYTASPPPPPSNDTDDDDSDSNHHHHSSSSSTPNDRIILSTTPSQPTQSQEDNKIKLSSGKSSKVKGNSLASLAADSPGILIIMGAVSIVLLMILLAIFFI